MKKSIITSLVLMMVALLATPALAEDTENTSTYDKRPMLAPVERVKEKMEEKRDAIKARTASTTERKIEMKEEVKERRDERKASSTERRIERQQGIAKRQAEHTGKVLTATILRLEKILARVESRIEKFKAQGVDTSISERFVAEAKAHLSEARQSIESFSSVDLSALKAKENFSRVRSIAMEVKTHLKAAHQSLMQAIRALKGPNSGEGSVNATSTVEVE